MKIKQLPEDFQVVEEADVTPAAAGPVALYRLHKEHVGTLEALGRAARLLGVPRGACAVAGLKDAHARTEQWLSAEGGPAEDRGDAQIRLVYAGRTDAPLRRAQVLGNRFRITLRDLNVAQAGAVAGALERCAAHGVPNYFDTQRFGSARATGAFPAKAILTGEPETGLRWLLAVPTRGERRRERRIHEIFAQHWGDWPAVLAALPRCPEYRVAAHLRSHPRDFPGAFEQLPEDLRHLVLAAWQSYLWNRIVAAWLARRLGPTAVAFTTAYQRLVRWETPAPELAAALDELRVPLPRHDAEYAGEWRELAAEVLGSEGVTVEGLFPRRLKRTDLRRGLRAARVVPAEPACEPPAADELNRGRFAVTLGFRLPRGAYATVVLKCLGLDAKPRQSRGPVGPRRER